MDSKMKAMFLSVGLLLAGCTTGSGALRREPLRFEGPSVPGPGWKRLQTADFELFTDLDEAQAQQAAQLLTQSMQGLTAMFGSAKPLVQRKLVVVALADGLEFERRFGPQAWGFAVPGTGETTVCVYGAPDRWFVRGANLVEATHSVLQHELAHAVLSRYVERQPTWFAEGMAQYLETFRWLDADTLVLGEPNVKAWRGYAAVRSVSMKELLAWGSYAQRETEISGRYGLAWAFVHFAINREPQRFSSLLADLVDGHSDAFERSFGEPTEALDQAIYAYLKQGQYSQLRLEVPLTAPAVAKFEPAPQPDERLRELEQAMKPR
jgi:hypothetical protein